MTSNTPLAQHQQLQFGTLYFAGNPSALRQWGLDAPKPNATGAWARALSMLGNGIASILGKFSVQVAAEPNAHGLRVQALGYDLQRMERRIVSQVVATEHDLLLFVEELTGEKPEYLYPDRFESRILPKVSCDLEIYEKETDKEKVRVCRSLARKLRRREDEADDEGAAADAQLDALAVERSKDLERLQMAILDYIAKYHQDPTKMIKEAIKGKYVPKADALVVNGNLEFILPGMNEAKVELYPLGKAIYILFLLHPEGIVLKRISDYRGELSQIYDIVFPTRDEAVKRAALNNVTDPSGDALRQNLSRIKRAFKLRFLGEWAAQAYFVTGAKGKPYKVGLDPAKVQLPKAFAGIAKSKR